MLADSSSPLLCGPHSQALACRTAHPRPCAGTCTGIKHAAIWEGKDGLVDGMPFFTPSYDTYPVAASGGAHHVFGLTDAAHRWVGGFGWSTMHLGGRSAWLFSLDAQLGLVAAAGSACVCRLCGARVGPQFMSAPQLQGCAYNIHRAYNIHPHLRTLLPTPTAPSVRRSTRCR